MTVIERVKELLKDEVVENVVESRFLCGGVADVVCVRDVELLLDSLASERCVWKPIRFHGDDQWQACEDNWLFVKDLPISTAKGMTFCPYCGKRIEVKED